ncbi:leucine-rich repeat-containing protein 69 [Erythrolamprus reginae]|uniref:leucine-rich repeat-containing protein 69 n=1 Tax=Erythrolamprus reginae TaxID=121349 RepID=UPI00396CA664
MAEGKLLRVLRAGSGTRSLSLAHRGLQCPPRGLASLSSLENLSLRDNQLFSLSPEMEALNRLKVLNLGNNNFEEVPEQLKYLKSLQKLYLFGNKITKMSPLIFDELKNLELLNLNKNQLSNLPPEICRLQNLECVSLENNKLEKIPKEFCYLQNLHELHLSHNFITSLPEDIKHLKKLKILTLSRNKIELLPDGICNLKTLKILDVAGNNIQVFPKAMGYLQLEEFYCEDNPLLQKKPVSAIQEEDILTLKEITARFIFTQLENENPLLCRAVKQNPQAQDLLSQRQKCAHCGNSFLGMWLECVRFIDIKQKRMKTSKNFQLLPVRSLICSYKCFYQRDREIFGISVW